MLVLTKLVLSLVLAPFSWLGLWLFGVGAFLLFCWIVGVIFT